MRKLLWATALACGLALGGGSNDFGVGINKILANGSTKEFQITIAVKATGKGSSGSTEFPKRRDDVQRRKRPEAKSPVITGGTVDENECVAKPSDTNAVPKCDVHMNGIEVLVLCFVKETSALSFWDGSVGTKRGGKFTAIDPFPIPTNLKKMFVVAEFTAAHDSMQLLRGPMRLGIGGIGGVTRPNRRERCAVVVKEPSDFLGGHCREKPSCRLITHVRRSVCL